MTRREFEQARAKTGVVVPLLTAKQVAEGMDGAATIVTAESDICDILTTSPAMRDALKERDNATHVVAIPDDSDGARVLFRILARRGHQADAVIAVWDDQNRRQYNLVCFIIND